MTTPSQAPIIEAMAEAAAKRWHSRFAGPDAVMTLQYIARMKGSIHVALEVASEAGWVLVPRAEVEATVKWLEQMATGLFNFDRKSADDLANRLRERSRG